jgi:serine/threonine-protein kinase ULK4
MDKYHIYDEIGKGEFSQVFKGREKKKIEYVAIKRIEKSVMNKVNSYFCKDHIHFSHY